MNAGPPDDVRRRPLVYVDDLEAPELAGDDHHHLARALRVGEGDLVTVADGAGRFRAARFGVRPVPAGEIGEAVWEYRELVVGLAPTKGARPEWAVQKLTELGATEIVLLETERSVVRWTGERSERARVRLGRVAREAGMQSRRCRLPVITGPTPLLEVVSRSSSIALAEPGAAPVGPMLTGILVGPEGGWSPKELASGAPTVGLGPTVLRTETAAVTAAVLLGACRAQDLPHG